ncbi:lysophospholipid acyltransferase family protein [Streptomyces sp. NPDC018711]|uniref:lysophospholipid acyltransferase family protein n=1 Tax=Streptomyces sp. NPDC018711 TaxID=3365052 RepID=UPI003791E82E
MTGATAVSPWLPTAPCTPGHCAAHPDTGRDGPAGRAGAVRAVARLTAGTGTVLLGVLLAPAAALLPAAARLALVRSWVRAVVRAFGVRVRYEGAAGAVTGPLLVVANHVSWLDIPLVAAVLPGRMVAKTEVRHWPVLGTLAALGGTLFLDRDRLRALPDAVREMAGVLAGGGRVVVFPEGSTWCGRARGRFRPAAFQAALDAGCAVLPVRIDYRPADAAAYVGDDPLGASLWRVVTAREIVANIRILDPIPSIRYPDRRALASAAQLAVARDNANLPSLSVHQRASSRSAAASSSRTPA